MFWHLIDIIVYLLFLQRIFMSLNDWFFSRDYLKVINRLMIRFMWTLKLLTLINLCSLFEMNSFDGRADGEYGPLVASIDEGTTSTRFMVRKNFIFKLKIVFGYLFLYDVNIILSGVFIKNRRSHSFASITNRKTLPQSRMGRTRSHTNTKRCRWNNRRNDKNFEKQTPKSSRHSYRWHNQPKRNYYIMG